MLKLILIQTANFVVQNTKGTRIGQTAQQGPDPYGIENRYRPGDQASTTPKLPEQPEIKKTLPHKQYLDIAAENLEVISKKILELKDKFLEAGQKDISLNPDELQALKALTAFLTKPSAPTSASAKSSQAVVGGLELCVKMITTWGNSKMPALDLLRVLARYSPAVPAYTGSGGILAVLDAAGAFDSNSPNNVMLGARTFVNMFHTPDGLKFVTENYEQVGQFDG